MMNVPNRARQQLEESVMFARWGTTSLWMQRWAAPPRATFRQIAEDHGLTYYQVRYICRKTWRRAIQMIIDFD